MRPRDFSLILLLLAMAASTHAQDFNLQRERVPMAVLNGLWLFHTSDDPDRKLKANRGSEPYQATNSSIACWYPRLESGEPRLRRAAVFECSRSGMPSLVLGRFFLPFALFAEVFLMIAALRRIMRLMGH